MVAVPLLNHFMRFEGPVRGPSGGPKVRTQWISGLAVATLVNRSLDPGVMPSCPCRPSALLWRPLNETAAGAGREERDRSNWLGPGRGKSMSVGPPMADNGYTAAESMTAIPLSELSADMHLAGGD